MRTKKHPLKSRSMVSAYLVIIIGILQYFGIINPKQNVQVTIDTLEAPTSVDKDKALGAGLGALGFLAIKGRKGAKTEIGDLI